MCWWLNGNSLLVLLVSHWLRFVLYFLHLPRLHKFVGFLERISLVLLSRQGATVGAAVLAL